MRSPRVYLQWLCLAFGLLGSVCGQAQTSSWEPAGDGATRLVAQPPGLVTVQPVRWVAKLGYARSVEHSVYVNAAQPWPRAEFLLYDVGRTARRYFSNQGLVPLSARVRETLDGEPAGSSTRTDNQLGVLSLQRFAFAKHEVSCAYFRQYLGNVAGVSLYGSAQVLGTRLIEGWVCGAPGEMLADSDIVAVVESMRVDEHTRSAPDTAAGDNTQVAPVLWDVSEVIRSTPVGRQVRNKGGPA